MIIREIKQDPDGVLKTFDFFNDYRDTCDWLRGDLASLEILLRLQNAYRLHEHVRLRNSNSLFPHRSAPWADTPTSGQGLRTEKKVDEAIYQGALRLRDTRNRLMSHNAALRAELKRKDENAIVIELDPTGDWFAVRSGTASPCGCGRTPQEALDDLILSEREAESVKRRSEFTT